MITPSFGSDVAVQHRGFSFVKNADLKQFLVEKVGLKHEEVYGEMNPKLPNQVPFQKLLKMNSGAICKKKLGCPMDTEAFPAKTGLINHFIRKHFMEEFMKKKKGKCCKRHYSKIASYMHMALSHNTLYEIILEKIPKIIPELCNTLKNAIPDSKLKSK